jgi:hypothetical protein
MNNGGESLMELEPWCGGHPEHCKRRRSFPPSLRLEGAATIKISPKFGHRRRAVRIGLLAKYFFHFALDALRLCQLAHVFTSMAAAP